MLNNNHTTLAGRLTRDPEITHVNNSTVTKFTIANNRRYRDSRGEWQDQVLFLDCEIWGNRSETLLRDGHKGREIIVEGQLQQDSWQNKDGQQHKKIFLRVSKVGLPQTTLTITEPSTTDIRDATH